MIHPLLLGGCLLSGAFAFLWWRQTRTRDATSVDAAWALAIGGGALLAGLAGDGATLPRMLGTGIALLWSGRLGYHLLRHRVFGHAGEDGRYRAMREHWGERADRHFFWFYQAQAAAAFAFALPFWWLAQHPEPSLSTLQTAGVAVFVLAQAGEWIADRQLERHRRDPAQRGRTCRSGLWAYSRHPNYFFEWLHWFAWVALSIGSPLWWLSLLGAVLMLCSLLWVTGIPFVEQQSLRSRGDAYRDYQRRVSVFVPWFRKAGPRVQGPGPS